MAERRVRRPLLPPGLRAGLAMVLIALPAALALTWPGASLRAWQERLFDLWLVALPTPVPVSDWSLVVVEIGTQDETGTPWTRAASARLAAALADAGPRLVGWDMVFAGSCDGPETRDLARALAEVPSVLGLLMSRRPASDAPAGQVPAWSAPPWLVAAGVAPGLWQSAGVELPCTALAAPGVGLASLALPGGDSALVRAVPAAVGAGGRLWPGLAAELLRRAEGAGSAALLGGTDGTARLRIGARDWPAAGDGTLRLRPSGPAVWAGRSVAATEVLRGSPLALARLAGAVVLVGVTVPQAGGLRPTAASPLHPSVQIAADALGGLAAGRVPYRPARAPLAEGAGLLLLAALAMLALIRLPAPAALGMALGLALVWVLAASAALALTDRLVDPLTPGLALMAATALALAVRAAAHQRAERALRRRMGQLLPPAIVARLAADPGLLRLTGEAREVTALFTDLEGFTDLVNRLPPEQVVARLEASLSRVVAAVLAEGGMVDKIVGDGVHALFNAPLDQPDHPAAALRAARAILAATEALRREPAGEGLGRTRIGIETGRAVLGDVGAGARIDYTAHGPAVNLAARLQEVARDLGEAVVIGPGCAAALQGPGQGLRPLGRQPVRSFGQIELFGLAD